jgi:hypothetical protein
VVYSINTLTFVALKWAGGQDRVTSISRSGSVRNEQRRHRPISAQPSGRQSFWVWTSLLTRHRSLTICSSFTPCLRPKSLAANVSGFMEQTT